MEDIKLIYKDHEDIVLINYFTSIIMKKNNNKGKFTIENNILKIIWNKIDIEEKFIKDEESNNENMYYYKYIDNTLNKRDDHITLEINKLETIFIFDKINKKIIDLSNEKIIYDVKIENDNILNVKFYNHYDKVFELQNDIYIDITDKYIAKINILNVSWRGICIINKYNNLLFREDNLEEYGTFSLNDNKLNIFWKKWDDEIFIYNSEKDEYINVNIFEYNKTSLTNNEEELELKEEELELKEDVKLEEEDVKLEEEDVKLKEEDVKLEEEVELTKISLETKEVLGVEKIEKETEFSHLDFYDQNYEIDNSNFISISDFDDFSTKEINISDENQNLEIYIYHKDWNEYCVIYDEKIYRKTDANEFGKYDIKDNELRIFWEKWESELFLKVNNIYYHDIFIYFLNYNDKTLIINIFNNKIIDNENDKELGNILFFDKELQLIWEYDESELYNFEYENNKILIYPKVNDDDNDDNDYHEKMEELLDENNNTILKIKLIKDLEENAILNNDKIILIEEHNNYIKNNGTFKIKNDLLYIYWDELLTCEIYKNINQNNVYYYNDYYEKELNKVLLINDNKDDENNLLFFIPTVIEYNISYSKNILYNGMLLYPRKNNNEKSNKIINKKFLNINEDYYILNDFSIENQCINKYRLEIVECNNNKYHIIHNNFEKNNFNYNIYKQFNKDLLIEDIDLYIHWKTNGIYENRIFSLESFSKKYQYFDIDGYRKNNNISNNIDSIIHYNTFGKLSSYFYTSKKDKIEIIHINKMDNLSNNILYVVNIDDSIININSFIKNIPKNNKIILNIQLIHNYLSETFIDKIISNYENIIITKSKNVNNFYILQYITKNIIPMVNSNNNLKYNILYINNFNLDLENDAYICNFLSYKCDIRVINNNSFINYNIYSEINYLYYLFKLDLSINDLIQIFIFYYIIKRTVFELPNNNFMVSYNELSIIINNNFSKYIFLLN